jgi:hypothetical protein
MSQPAQLEPQSSGEKTSGIPQRPSVAIGNAPFCLVLLSAILALVPGSRAVGLAFLLLLAVPACVVWVRARKLTDGSRGRTTSTLVIGIGALIIGGALTTPAPTADAAPAAPGAPVEQAVAPAPRQQYLVGAPPAAPVEAAAQPVAQAPLPVVQTPPPAAAYPPRAAPMPQQSEPEPSTTQDSGGAVYYKNCTAARAAGAAPIQRGEPGYRPALDRDNDGTACEQ